MKTRAQRAKELWERLLRGPAPSAINGPPPDPPEVVYRRWSQSWILEDIKALIPELRDASTAYRPPETPPVNPLTGCLSADHFKAGGVVVETLPAYWLRVDYGVAFGLRWILWAGSGNGKGYKLTGNPGESKNEIKARFQRNWPAVKIEKWTRYKGVLAEAEAVVTLASLERPDPIRKIS